MHLSCASRVVAVHSFLFWRLVRRDSCGWIAFVTLLLEWRPKVVTIAHGAPYQHTTMVSRPNGRILIRWVSTHHHWWLMRSCQDAKGKRMRKTYVSLGNLYFIREGSRSVYASHLKSLIKVAGQAKREIWQKSRGESKEVTSSAK